MHRNAVNAFKEGVVCVGLRTVVRPWLILGGRPRPEFWSVIPKAKTVLVCCQGQTELEVPAVGNTGHGLQEDLPEPQFLEILQYVP